MTRRRAARASVAVLGTVAAVLSVPAAGAGTVSVHDIATFDRASGQTPESVAVAPGGTVYVSLSFASQVRRITPDGAQTTLTLPTAGGITVGLVFDRRHHDDLDVAVRSADPAASGIWRVPRAGFDHSTRIVPLPTGSFPNGMTFDRDGTLYVADSTAGRIWRVRPGASRATVWAAGPLLSPTGESFQGVTLPGANGVKIHGRTLYVSNTAARTILTIPIDRHGNAGPVAARFRGVEADDFAIAADGDLYVTENPPSRLVRITPAGKITTIATAADGLDNPSDVVFAPDRRRDFVISNSAYFGTHPSILEIRAGKPAP